MVKVYVGRLPCGTEFLVDAEDEPRIKPYTWQIHPQKKIPYLAAYLKRAETRSGSTTIMMHRLVLGAPKGRHVDHINGNALDNRKQNLRIVTARQNAMNVRKRESPTSSRFKGVHLRADRNLYCAMIRENGRTYNLGHYRSEAIAALVYDLAAVKAFGEYASTNTHADILRLLDMKAAEDAIKREGTKGLIGRPKRTLSNPKGLP